MHCRHPLPEFRPKLLPPSHHEPRQNSNRGGEKIGIYLQVPLSTASRKLKVLFKRNPFAAYKRSAQDKLRLEFSGYGKSEVLRSAKTILFPAHSLPYPDASTILAYTQSSFSNSRETVSLRAFASHCHLPPTPRYLMPYRRWGSRFSLGSGPNTVTTSDLPPLNIGTLFERLETC
jgi:hypothetical protein